MRLLGFKKVIFVEVLPHSKKNMCKQLSPFGVRSILLS